MKVLVTGADGFIGRNVCNVMQKYTIDLIQVIGAETDLCNHQLTKEIITAARPDVILHLAAAVGVDKWTHDDGKLLHNNLMIDINVKSAIDELDYQPRIIYASSSEVYHDSLFDDTETQHVLKFNHTPRDNYSLGKYVSERLFDDINLRLFNIVGPDQNENFALPKMIKAALHNEDIYASGDFRSFCSIDDAAPWIAQFVLQVNEIPAGSYNIGNPANFISMRDMAELIKQELHSTSKIISYDDGFSPIRKPIIEKASKYYQPKFDLRYIIQSMLRGK